MRITRIEFISLKMFVFKKKGCFSLFHFEFNPALYRYNSDNILQILTWTTWRGTAYTVMYTASLFSNAAGLWNARISLSVGPDADAENLQKCRSLILIVCFSMNNDFLRNWSSSSNIFTQSPWNKISHTKLWAKYCTKIWMKYTGFHIRVVYNQGTSSKIT